MNAPTVIETRPGVAAAIGRFFERINVAVTLHFAEQDVAYYRELRDRMPRLVAMLEHDLEELRVRNARLQRPISQPEMQ